MQPTRQRIITLQRQVRELGRLRTGSFIGPTDGKRGRPARSDTWIITSHQRDYIDAAAEVWGGEVVPYTPMAGEAKGWQVATDAVAIDAVMPPGDPLSQAYEMWNRGGCVRRCDGVTDSIGRKPCLCLAEFGEDFHLQPPEKSCRPHTRLSVILPDIPDLGVWRLESKSFWGANEIPATVDLILASTGGTLAVPIRLRIEPRERIAAGKTKRFPVVVVEVRGSTAGQILSGNVNRAELGGSQSAIGGNGQHAIAAQPHQDDALAGEVKPTGATKEQRLILVRQINDPDALRKMWKTASADGVMDEDLAEAIMARKKYLEDKAAAKASREGAGNRQTPAEPEPGFEAPDGEPVDGDVEPDIETTWGAIMNHAGEAGWTTADLEDRLHRHQGVDSADANGWQMAAFLNAIKSGEIK